MTVNYQLSSMYGRSRDYQSMEASVEGKLVKRYSIEGGSVEGSSIYYYEILDENVELLVDDGELSVEFEVWSVGGLPVEGSISRVKHQSRDDQSRDNRSSDTRSRGDQSRYHQSIIMKILDEKVELLVDNGELSVEFEVWSVEGLPVDGSISRWKHQSRDNRSREASVEG
ncbi:UNVERIFIED_CONTAM: hypothetical protein RMT77_019381 [Armadillidium vulgare]